MTPLNHLDISHRAGFLKVSEQQEEVREARIDPPASPQVKSTPIGLSGVKCSDGK